MLKLDSRKLGYKGRMTSLIFVAAIIVFFRGTVMQQYNEVPHVIPIPAVIILIIAWQLGKLYDRQSYLTMRDSLTNLYNRRFVGQRFSKLTAYANRRGLKIATIILDVNDFKEINDVYGHEVGDKVLIGISNILESGFGKKDIVARWGGDEFLVLSLFSDEASIDKRLHRLKEMLESEWEIQETISVSIGKAFYPNDQTDLKTLVAMADANMYDVKFSQKNKSKLDSPTV